MIRVGLVGLGFMGRMHVRCWKPVKGAKVVAICDMDRKKFSGGGAAAGNIGGAADTVDLRGIATFTNMDQMLMECKLDAVDICLPTYLHAEHTVKALQAGLHVLCEKPMALTSEDCREMTVASKKARRILQVGHCIRFWPEYAKAKEIVDAGRYGKVMAATFQRLSGTPTWSWNGWIVDGARSGGAALDLHIHDADFVQYLFGMPGEVFSRGIIGPTRDFDHIVTHYIYNENKVVTAEGGWIMTPGFGFQMSFTLVLHKATLVYDSTRKPAFRVCPDKGQPFTPEVEKGDGYSLEIRHFAQAVLGRHVPAVLTPEQSCNSVRLIEAEKKSIKTGKKILLA